MLAIFIPISGWVADKYGAKKVFIGALSVFTISSLTCGLASSLTELIIMRCFQGIGGAFMVPIARLLLVRSVARHELVKAMGQVMMLGSFGIMLGPVLGGVITEYWSWPWIFFLNIPIGIFAIVLVWYKLENVVKVDVPKFDILGFLLFGLSLACCIFGLSALSEEGFNLHYASLLIGAAIILLILYFLHARFKVHAIVNMQLFKFHSFRISVAGNLLARIGFGGIPFLLPLLLQICFHYSPANSGLLLMPMALGVMLSKAFVTTLLRFLGYRHFLMLNTALISIVIASFALLNIHTSWIIIAIQVFVLGVLFSQQYSGMNSLAYQELGQKQLSSATSFMGTLQQFSQSLGVAITALLMKLGLELTHTIILTEMIFEWVFVILGIITLATIIIFFRLQKNDFANKNDAVQK
jgi:EmrB/QacA subfamily drug resistance transporter